MYKIVIASHGELGNGMKDSLGYFYNDLSEVSVVTLDKDGLSLFQKNLDNVFAQIGEHDVLFFTDLLYGTPFNEISKRAMLLSNTFEIIAGVNMPILLEAVNYQQQGDELSKVLPSLIDFGKVDLFSERLSQMNDSDDE